LHKFCATFPLIPKKKPKCTSYLYRSD